MANGSFLNYEALGIADLLRTKLMAVPLYQRAYSWCAVPADASGSGDDQLQVLDFWNDLSRSYADGKKSYFLGTTVLARGEEGDRLLVIDGQQRLATTSLLIAAIRDRFTEGGQKQFADSTQQEFIGKFNRQQGSDQPIFSLSSDDREFYNEYVVKSNFETVPTNPSQKLIQSAFRFLKQKIEEFAVSLGSDWLEGLNDFLAWIQKDVQVVAIEVAGEADAFLIFETLNDRGADLTVADLLKNYLFSQSGDRLDEVQNNWQNTLTNLGIERVGNQRFTDFVRHYLSSKHGVTREREVYQRIKNEVSTPELSVKFSAELKANSRLYHAVVSSEHEYWSEFPTSSAYAIRVLNELKLEQYRPLLLAVLGNFNKTETTKFLPFLVSWVIRALSIGVLGSGSAETGFSDAAKEIHAGKLTTTQEIFDKRMRSMVPDDKSFEDAFGIWRVTRGPLARYLLRTLELEKRGVREAELIVNENVEEVNLEHILPKNASAENWPNFTEDEAKNYVHRLGNLCLLQKGPNSRIGNKKWSVKEPVLRSSELLLTKEAGKNHAWGKNEIESRQTELAKLAVTAWPRF